MSITYQTKIVTTTPYTIVNSDEVIFSNVNTSSTIILPTLNSNSENTGKSFYIKDYSGNSLTKPITITTSNSKTIDGVSFAILNGGYSHIQVVYDGTNWKTI